MRAGINDDAIRPDKYKGKFRNERPASTRKHHLFLVDRFLVLVPRPFQTTSQNYKPHFHRVTSAGIERKKKKKKRKEERTRGGLIFHRDVTRRLSVENAPTKGSLPRKRSGARGGGGEGFIARYAIPITVSPSPSPSHGPIRSLGNAIKIHP